jgi:hypothetical protein
VVAKHKNTVVFLLAARKLSLLLDFHAEINLIFGTSYAEREKLVQKRRFISQFWRALKHYRVCSLVSSLPKQKAPLRERPEGVECVARLKNTRMLFTSVSRVGG